MEKYNTFYFNITSQSRILFFFFLLLPFNNFSGNETSVLIKDIYWYEASLKSYNLESIHKMCFIYNK